MGNVGGYSGAPYEVPTVYPKEAEIKGKNLLEVVYDKGPVPNNYKTFDVIKADINKQMSALPKKADVISTQMKYKIAELIK